MGIIGLTSLIEVNPHLLTNVQLRDTNLVIDGNSFCYQLYHASRIDSRFAGDYERYATTVRRYLDQFDAANIRTSFVFDGLLDVEKLKKRTALQRQRQRLMLAKSIVSMTIVRGGGQLLPLLAHQVLVDILIARRIEIHQSAGEADGMAVGLANDLGAPLLSLDSDFFIFDLKFGYVPFDTIELSDERREGGETAVANSYVRAKLYRLENLLEHYPDVDRRLLPLFAFLCGNDFSAGHNLGKFFAHIHRPDVQIAGGSGREVSSRRRRSTKGERPMHRHCNMIAVLEWLRDMHDENEAIEEALSSIELKRRDKIREAIKRSMAAYQRCEPTTTADGTSSSSASSFDPTSITQRTIAHLNLPDWFVDEYVRGKTPAILLHIRQDRRVFLPALIENFSKPSVYDCCRPIRIAVYRILLDHESDPKRFVFEYSRNGEQYVKRQLPIDDVDNEDDPEENRREPSLSVPSLDEVQKLSVDERRRIFLDVFRFSNDESNIIDKFPDRLALFACSFVFWCRSDDVRANRSQACALLFCVVWLCSRKCSDDHDEPVFDMDNSQQLDNLREFDYTPELSKKRGSTFAISNLHAFNQWQASYQACVWLDSVLTRPFGSSTVPPQRLFHGRIAYNLTAFVQKSKSESAAFDHLFKDAPTLRETFVDLWELVKKLVPEIDSNANAGRAKNGKKANRKPSKVIESVAIESESEKSEQDDEEANNSDDGDWGLENRFRMLSLKK